MKQDVIVRVGHDLRSSTNRSGIAGDVEAWPVFANINNARRFCYFTRLTVTRCVIDDDDFARHITLSGK